MASRGAFLQATMVMQLPCWLVSKIKWAFVFFFSVAVAEPTKVVFAPVGQLQAISLIFQIPQHVPNIEPEVVFGDGLTL